MKVSDIMEKEAVSVEGGENVVKALNKMKENGVNQLPILDGEKYSGMVILKDLLSTAFDPVNTEIRKFRVSVPTLHPDDELDDCISKILGSGYTALPVVVKDKIVGVVSLTDLIRHVEYPQEDFFNHFVCDITTVNDTDSLAKALSLMYEHNISRLPVLDWEGKVVGVFDAMGMIDFIKNPRESIRFSRMTAIEKSSLKDFVVKDYMRATATMGEEEFTAPKVIKELQKHEEVVLVRDGAPVGLVIAKDLLEHSKIKRLPQIVVVNYGSIDPMMYARMEDLINKFIGKFSKMVDLQKFILHADSYHHKLGRTEPEGRTEFYFRAKVITAKKTFFANSRAWNEVDATHMLLKSLEREIIKHRELSMHR